ncbi:protein kinase domain-containing protein ppk32 [Phyllosticta citribraziliensis]|uniref:Protein kinase domain-containing protein ppk32 n=1 Tax=Phyllosticta citribraziliensis TaxID=989973 RepID=A0ABR1LN33_9PEZI
MAAQFFSSAVKSLTSNIGANYSIASNPCSTSGPWKIFDAKKKSTGKAVSVFVFEKKSLEPNGGGFGPRSTAGSLKRAHEEVVERLKKEVSCLARLRHPSVLELAEPVEETRTGGLIFATEPVTASLAGLLQEKDDQERSGGPGGRSSRYVVEEDGSRRRREVEIDELEIQKGLLQIGKGLEFLHESAGLVHGNLTPDAIFINAKSDWKISGLGFCSPPENSTKATSVTPISLSEILNYDPRLPLSVQISLDFASPDFVMDNNITTAADMFSLGLLIIALYNSPHQSPLETNQSASTYKRLFASSSSIPTQNNNFLCKNPLPRDLASSVLPRLITRRPAQRLNAREFQQAQYFDNILVSTIRFLDSLPAKTAAEKSQFMRGLPRVLNQFPKSVLEKKVLPALLEEMKDRELLSLVLQNVFKIITTMPSGRRAFSERVLPKLRQVFLSTTGGKPVQAERDTAKEAGLMIILDQMRLISESCNGKEFKDDVLPLIQLALESPTHSIVDAALRTLPVIIYVLDFSTIKNEFFPVVANVFAKTTSMGIKIRGLQAFRTLCGGGTGGEDGDSLEGMTVDKSTQKQNPAVLDKYTIQEKVVPLLKAIKTKEPAVMMAALEVFQEVGKIADSEFLAMDVLPILWNFSLGPLLNLQQFQAFMTLIKQLSTRIEHEHTRKLQELSTSNAASGSATANDFMSFGSGPGISNGFGGSQNGGDDDFESLVTGRGSTGGGPMDALDGGWGTSSRTTSPPLSAGFAQSANPRTQNLQSQSDGPRFSWSTPPPQHQALTPSPHMGMGTLRPQPTSSTPAMTSANSLNNFVSPQSSAAGPATGHTPNLTFSLPLQPSRPSQNTSGFVGTGTLNPTRPQTNTGATNPPSNSSLRGNAASIDWSAAARPANPPTGSAFGGMGHFGNTMPKNQSPYSNFSIAPPPIASTAQSPSGTSTGMNLGGQQQNKTSGQGGTFGMEKYESLI